MPAGFQYGGQAVIEGVMMRGPRRVAVAVRRPAGDVLVDQRPLHSVMERWTCLKWPLLRGVVALVESLVLGVQALTFSAGQQAEEEEEQLSSGQIALTLLLAFGLAAVLFIVIPTATAHLLQRYMNNFWQNLAEGGVRIVVFVVYVLLISRIGEIQRVFQYHGAEHKVIHVHEAGEPLTVENARKYGTLHPRCGTAFLLIVMVLTILVYSFLYTPGLIWRIGSRLLLLPLVAGLGYEALKLSSRHTHRSWVRALIAPGLWLQKLTTREPDDSQVEVAIRALTAVIADSTELPLDIEPANQN